MTDLSMPKPNTLLAAIQNGWTVALYRALPAALVIEEVVSAFISERLERAIAAGLGNHSRGEIGLGCQCSDCRRLTMAIAASIKEDLGITALSSPSTLDQPHTTVKSTERACC